MRILRNLILSAFLIGNGYAESAPPVIPFEASTPVHMPSGEYLGECSGVAVNSKGHIFVLSRGNTSGPANGAAAAQLFEFDKTGKFIREIGHNLYAWSFAHTVKVDRDDNIWVTDKGSSMIIKFNPAGEVIMVIGRKQEPLETASEKTEKHQPAVDGYFRQVTDVAWDNAGNTYISDGYVNSRIAEVDKSGKWIRSWGSYGNKPGQFNTPHSIAVDAKGYIYVADRGNRRIQVFDGNGTFVRQITINVPVPLDAVPAIGNKPPALAKELEGLNQLSQPGSPWAICITQTPTQFLYVADAYPGRIYKLDLNGKVLGVLGESGKQLKQFGWIHQIACPSENELYVAELLNWRVQKLILKSK